MYLERMGGLRIFVGRISIVVIAAIRPNIGVGLDCIGEVVGRHGQLL